MKEIKTIIVLYEYDELTGEAKEKAYEDHFDFLCENPADYEDGEGNIKYMTAEDYDKEAVEDSIKVNNYLFFVTGEMADCVTYTGKHKRAGTTEFNFQGFTYKL